MVPKPKKKASKAALNKQRPAPTTAQKLGEEPRVPKYGSAATKPSKSPPQTSDQLAGNTVPRKLQAIKQAQEKLEAVDDKIKRLEEMRKVCENALTAVKELQKK